MKQHLLGTESLAEKMQKIKTEMDISENATSSHKTITTQNDRKSLQAAIRSDKSKIIPKLFVSGRLDRKKHGYVAKSLILLTQLEEEIKSHCRGGDLAILNYLIKEGLEKVKASDVPINVDIEEIESNII